MHPTLALREKAMQLLAADTATLAPAVDAIKMALVKNAFTSDEALKFSDLTLADFDGSTPLDIGTGPQAEGLNPGTNDAVIDLLPPAGGFRWETTGLTHLPQTIYGYVVLNHAMDTVLASARFPQDINLTAVNQRVDGLDASILQLANSMS